jgi:bifunctional DNA-binding transcriptional regulator/antitoxin component of YhaV-PrlF toxin-antitoxin module
VRLAKHIDRVVAIRDGRTSSEIVRRRSYREELEAMSGTALAEGEPDAGGEEFTHEELVVLDRSGRLQLPKDHMDALKLKGGDKVRVELDDSTDEKRIFIRRSDV